MRVAIPASLHDVVAAKLTEQMPVACAESPSRALAPAAYDRIAELLERVDAVALGPGLSRDPGAAELARRVVAEAATPVVIDADALSALAGSTERIARAPAPRVLTPHLGEMARLTGVTAEALEAARIDAPREWARRWNAVVVLKGAPTVVAAADGDALVNPTGNPGMATAGTGDVLTGVIASLLAQGVEPLRAAATGAYVHGRAADVASDAPDIVASDLVVALPRTLHELRNGRDPVETA